MPRSSLRIRREPVALVVSSSNEPVISPSCGDSKRTLCSRRVNVPVTLSATPTSAVSVTVSTADGTAKAPGDYVVTVSGGTDAPATAPAVNVLSGGTTTHNVTVSALDAKPLGKRSTGEADRVTESSW